MLLKCGSFAAFVGPNIPVRLEQVAIHICQTAAILHLVYSIDSSYKHSSKSAALITMVWIAALSRHNVAQ